jgi:hypothetical protein
MKKIKHFKINCRTREILRLLKTTTKITEITPELEEAVQNEIRRLQPVFAPAAIYETQPREKIAAALIAAPPENWVAASAFLVTIGPAIEQEIKDAQHRGENVLSQILHAVALEALDRSGSFVQRLIGEEAKDESCEVSRDETVAAAGWDEFVKILPGDKIGVQRLSDAGFQPVYSSSSVVYWTPVKKRGK